MTKRTQLYLMGAIIAIIGIAVVVAQPRHGSTSTMVMPDTVASQSQNATATDKVNIQNFMFNPMTIKVKVGTTVTWTNLDAVHHNVVADTISTDAPNGPLLAKDQHYSFTFKKSGTYTLHCNPHPYMHGTVVVTE